MTLTIETLNAAQGLIGTVPVGMECNPQVADYLKRNFPANPLRFDHQLPLLINPRLGVNENQVYYDQELWRERCKELSLI